MKSSFDLSKYAEHTMLSPFSFAKHSSIGCGGQADVAFFPHTVDETVELVAKLTEDGVPYLVLGNLTNVLPSDEGYGGAIISTKRLDEVTVGEELFALAGVPSGGLLYACKQAGLCGAEFLKGIPCTFGGALYMNAGAGGKYISELVDRVLVLRKGEKIILSKEECAYAYKQSVFMQNEDIILGGWLRLEKGTEEEILEKEREYFARRAHLPEGRSMGCVFKNPEGKFAGDLIERTGLKGFRWGGAKVSEKHANFIINDKGATAKQIRALITLVKNAVYAQYGVRLQEEIRYL